jgi:glycosyltransferase involved in cell wall biosynthesis
VVTPSYNQAAFLEATIRSVLLQGYPDLEYIVMDGGSTDGSVEIIERYAPWITFRRSGSDRGQSDAINRGFSRASGTVIGWLNSDDVYYSGALATAGAALADGAADIFVGAMDKVLVQGGAVEFVRRSSPHEGAAFHHFPIYADGRRHGFHFTQPPSLWTRDLWERTGGLDERYHYQMDREWLNRALAAGARVRTDDAVLARFTLHPGSKSKDFVHRFQRERVQLYLRLAREPGFRAIPCLLHALHPLQQVLGYRASQARERGQTVRSITFSTGARALSALRRTVPGLRGDRTVRSATVMYPSVAKERRVP